MAIVTADLLIVSSDVKQAYRNCALKLRAKIARQNCALKLRVSFVRQNWMPKSRVRIAKPYAGFSRLLFSRGIFRNRRANLLNISRVTSCNVISVEIEIGIPS